MSYWFIPVAILIYFAILIVISYFTSRNSDNNSFFIGERKSPWYIVPADDKENTRLIISQILIDTFKKLKMSYPKPSKEHLRELKSIRKSLEKESL